ncbi:MAG: TonB-dependent receptor [Terracidiphilus sp.]
MTTATSLWNRLAWITVIAFVIAVSSTARLNAQGYAKIVGTVTDPSGAVIPSATVTATATKTGVATTVKTGGDGAYVFPALLPTNYSITVVATGFEKYTQSGIVLEANQSATINIKLVVGSSAVTISVVGDAPAIDTTSGTLSQVIDESRVVDLPLNGRNAAALINLVAGVVDATNEGNGTNQGNGKTFPAAVVSSTNGTLPAQQNYLLDGGNNVDEMTNVNGPFPFPDALQEFSVQTSNYDSAFGQSAGGVVNIIIKSGASKFHGDAFEFVRNGYFNAKPYFATVADNVHRHQYGGVIGGPVIIPHFSSGKSTQFFFGYQHTLYHANSNATQTTVPTLAEEGRVAGVNYADFSSLCVSPNGWSGSGLCAASGGSGAVSTTQQIYNPFNGVAYPNNHIPSSDFDPAAVILEQDFPTSSADATVGSIGGPVNYFKPTIQSFDEYVARVDHQFGEKDHLFGHYYYNYYQQAGVFNPTMLASYASYFNTRYQNALLAETHSFTSNLLNNLIANYQREVALRGGPPGSYDITHYGVNNIWQPNTGPYMSFGITGFFGASGSAFAAWGRNNYTFNDDLHWVKGKHNFAVGGHFELSKYDVTNVYQSYGGFTSAKAGTSLAVANVNAMANFQVGFLSAFTQGNFEQVNDRNHFPGIYAQDSWKISHKFTLNYGVRWEDFAPWSNRDSVEQEFFPANYVANTHTAQFSALPAGMMLTGDPGIPQWGLNNKYTQFMPRAGFAYDIKGDGKTVVRGGGGMFYQDRMPGFFNLSQASFVPNTIAVNFTNSLGTSGSPGGPLSNPYCTGGCLPYGAGYSPTPPGTLGANLGSAYTNPFPFTLPFPSSKVFPTPITLVEYDPSGNFQVPVTYSYNLTVEHELAPGWSVRAAYVGSSSRHQFVNLELNPAVNTAYMVGSTLTYPGGNSGATSTAAANTRRPYNTAPAVGPCVVANSNCNQSYTDIINASMSGSSKFNSLQTTLEKKMSHGLSLLLNYTWSKSMDDMPQATRVSNTEDLNAGESYVYPVYPKNLTIPSSILTNAPNAGWIPTDYKALDRGRSDIDKPHALSVSYVYDLPKMNNGNHILRYVVSNWRTSGLFQHHSGDSLTVWTGSDTSATGLGQDRGQRDYTKPAYSRQSGTGLCGAGKLCVNWFNNQAFSTPANTGAGTGYGNVVKGSLRGPGYTNWDVAAIRAFPVYRGSSFEFRAEYFDVLNHTLLSNPQLSTTNAAFGTITGASSPRIAQFSMKFVF